MTDVNYLDTLSEFICDGALDHFCSETIEHGRWVLADCIPVIAAGMQEKQMRSLCQTQINNARTGDAWVIGTGLRTNAYDAAFLNGTAGTWLELDEGNMVAKGHPGIQVVPAAIAVAQDIGASGKELLTAVILGYEISSRISYAADVRLSVHPHGTYGVIGAAVAVGRLLKLNKQQMRQLLNISATLGLATSRKTLLDGATVRNVYTGHSALMGQMAVRLTLSGFTGEYDGVGSIYSSVLSDTFNTEQVTANLGSDWLMNKGYFKLHCTGRYIHSVIDALEDALAHASGPVDIEEIDRIDVKTYHLAAMLGGKSITTSFGARFSVPFALATILYHKESSLKAFSDDAVANPRVQELLKRVYVSEEPAYNQFYPHKQICDLTITLKGGSVVSGRCDITKGEESNPHTTEDLVKKFFTLGVPAWGDELTRKLYEMCMNIEKIENFKIDSSQLSL